MGKLQPDARAKSASLADVLGRRVTLSIARVLPTTVELAMREGGSPSISMPRREAPADAREGGALDALVFIDGDDRPCATTRPTKLVRGEVAFLRVSALAPFGAFVEWGPPKELLVPLDEQTRPLKVGDRAAVALLLDDTDRLVGTMKVRERLAMGGPYARDEWVEGEAWREEPGVGLFVILERRTIGLLPATEPHRLRVGDAARFRVARVHPDGKVEISLRGLAVDEMAADGARVLDELRRPGAPRVSDASSPEEIRARFGLSKKAFKRAVGGLLRQRLVRLDEEGFVVANEPTTRAKG